MIRHAGVAMGMTDDDVARLVREELACEPCAGARQFAASVRDGVVTLRGAVESHAARLAVEHAIKRVRGVRAVASDLAVAIPVADRRSDAAIADTAQAALEWHAMVPPGSVSAVVSDGWITLVGEVGHDQQRQAAVASVSGLRGVRGVRSRIAVVPGDTLPPSADSLHAALARHAGIDASCLDVDVRGSVVTLRGVVHTLAERQAVMRTAWSSHGVSDVVDDLQLAE